MKPVVHQAFGDVFDRDRFEGAQIENALVRDQAAVPFVEDREMLLQAPSDVIGVENGYFGCLSQAIAAHQPDVNPWYDQDAGAAPRSRRNRSDALLAAGAMSGCRGRNGARCCATQM